MGTHARELLSTLMKLAHVLKGQAGAQPYLASFTHVASALSQDAERLAELTGTAGELAPESVDLLEALQSAAVLLAGALPPSIHVAVEVDPATAPAFCNPLALQQALLALADHARDGMPVGGHLMLSALPSQAEGCVEIQVRDTGAASALVDDEDSRQRRSSGERGRRGMDLALPLIRDLMDRMGGQVTVASSVSTGTCVVLTLPGGTQAPAAAPAGRVRVLVVDDDAGLRRVTARMLEQSGMEVTTAADGGEALQQLSGGSTWSALLLDLHMPRADGSDVLRFVQVMPNPPAVVVFTADDVNVVKKDILALGAFAVMPKPFLGRELVATLKAAMRARQV
jgi:CheY-like chemotaxis protein